MRKINKFPLHNRLSIILISLIAAIAASGCNLYRSSYSFDATNDFKEIINTDYMLAQDCVIYKTIKGETTSNHGDNYIICTKSEFESDKSTVELGKDNKIEFIENIPQGTRCNIIALSGLTFRSGCCLITLYLSTLKIKEYKAIAYWDNNLFLHSSVKAEDRVWGNYLIPLSKKE
ncbi:MAG TPA: hypothetical protein DET40_10100 [Lentisphaeria bacterium]|nr:MAG: hypothetical protein A2X45_21790 [Lentisphaerae bacterium GWF2_50_93]HCE43887.1 hypothetical protein [Lentisphaeria bacterium]